MSRPPRCLRLPEAERQRAVSNLRLAEQLGAETVTLRGRRIAEEIVNFARRRHITKIIAGKPTRRPSWKVGWSGSPLDELLRLSGDLEVRMLSGPRPEPGETAIPAPPKRLRWSGYEGALLYLIVATALGFLMYPFFDLPNLIMVYLLAVLVTAIQCGRGPAILNSLLSVLTFDFCFVPPRWSFTVEEAKYLVTFVVMFLVAVVISHLSTVIRRQAEAARLQERQTAAMYALSRQLAGTGAWTRFCRRPWRKFRRFSSAWQWCCCGRKRQVTPAAGELSTVFHKDIVKELGVAQAAFETGRMAGWGTQTSPDSPILYVPLPGPAAPWGS